MSKTVFILGAGTSVCVGAPLVSNFLTEALNLLEQNKVDESRSQFIEVFDTINQLQVIFQKSRVNLDDIEEILGLIEVGKIINALPEKINYDTIFLAFNRLILETLEKKILFEFDQEGRIRMDKTFEDFISLIKMLKKYKYQDSSIITFNYDITLDAALRYRNLGPVYYFEEDSKADQNYSIPLLKLHGSLNWTKCKHCGKINSFDTSKIFNSDYTTKSSKNNINILSYFKGLVCYNCKEEILNPEPIIVPPLFNKIDYQLQIKNVWNKAAKELAEADNVVIIGYSLRDSDYFFKYFYSLGSISTTRIKKFIVIDPNNRTRDSFRKLIGGDIENKFIPIQGNFENCKDTLTNYLEIFPERKI